MIVLFFVLLGLGFWQLQRAAEKRALRDALAEMLQAPALHLDYLQPTAQNLSPAPVGRQVSSKGHFDTARQFLLDNQARAGVSGYWVLTPFLLEGGTAVMVNRGWLPAGADRSKVPNLDVENPNLELRGRITRPYRPALLLSGSEPEHMSVQITRIQHVDLAFTAQQLQRPVLPIIVEMDPELPGGYQRQWTLPELNAERHTAYAVQWFALAGLFLVIVVRSVIVDRRRQGHLR
jgi:surfeit locus 1 family protein